MRLPKYLYWNRDNQRKLMGENQLQTAIEILEPDITRWRYNNDI